MDDQIVDQLSQLLSPLGSQRAAEVLAWMQHEAETRALVTFCWDGLDRQVFFEIGKLHPYNEKVTIFAMLHWEQPNCVVVFGFEIINTNGGAMVQYHRSLVFSPKLVTGPVSGDGLYNELRMFMLGGDDDEPEPTAATNGAQEVRQ
jgi:hypothetical protein